MSIWTYLLMFKLALWSTIISMSLILINEILYMFMAFSKLRSIVCLKNLTFTKPLLKFEGKAVKVHF